MNEPRSLARGAFLVTLGSSATLVAGGVVAVLVARLLGPAGSGVFGVISGLFITLLALSTVGLELGLGWMVGGRRWSAASALTSSAVAAPLLGVLGIGIGLTAYALASDTAFRGLDVETTLLGLSALIPALACAFVFHVGVATERYEAAFWIGITQAGFFIAGVAALGAIYELPGAVAGILVGNAVGAVVAVFWARRIIAGEEPAALVVDLRRLYRAVRFGIQFHVANALSILTSRFDIFLVSAYAGSTEAGYYAVAVASTQALAVVPRALGTVLFPRLASLGADVDEATRRELEDRALRHTTLIVVGTGALFAVTLPLLLEPVFGESFGPALLPAMLLIPGVAALGLAGTLFAALAGRGRPDYAMWTAAGVTPLALALYFALVPSLHATGAAIGSVIAYVAGAVLAAVFLRRLSGAHPPRRLRPRLEDLRDYLALRPGAQISGT